MMKKQKGKSKREQREELRMKRLAKVQQKTSEGKGIEMTADYKEIQIAQRHTQATLIEHYAEKYGTPANDEEAIKQLCIIYRELMNVVVMSKDVSDGIGEYYRLINHRDLPAFEWILEAIHVTSKKSQEKRNFKYIVGMLRQWLKYGFGHIPNSEEAEVIDYFEEVIGTGISAEARSVIENLMGRYGAIKVTRMIGSLDSSDLDISLVKANTLKNLIERKYSSK